MFGFFKKRPPADPPTDKQLRYAARLGIKVPPNMTKTELSDIITNAERKNPTLVKQREKVKSKVREKKFGKELVEEENRWNQIADESSYMLMIYKRHKKIIVDVLRINGAFIDERGKLTLEVDAPMVVKDRYIGDYLDWDNNFELPIESLLYHEPLDPEFYTHDAEGYGTGNNAYRAIVDKGLKIASKL